MSLNAKTNLISLGVGLGAGIGVWLGSGVWFVGMLVGLGVGAQFDERMRRRRGLPPRRALIGSRGKHKTPEE